jgi:L-threonylcarbamoyladenylate synthase
VVALPTESSFGLAVDARSPAALAALFALKQREPAKPPPLLVDGVEMLPMVVKTIPSRAKGLMANHWPGPLTLVLPARDDLPAAVVADGGVGVRHSPHALATALVRAFGAPLTATSANLAGAPPAMSAAEVRAIFGARVHVVPGAAGGGAPSTVVRVADDGTLTVVRRGAIDPSRLR